MDTTRSARAAAAAVLLLLLPLLTVSCEGRGVQRTDEAPPADTQAAAGPARADAPPEPQAQQERPEPEEIYYDLTEYEWYREGEALEHEGRGHMPAGLPRRIPADSLEGAGQHEGVRYYRRPGGGDTLFVPVYPRYWQPFVPGRR